jgi:hypothetical protein
MAYEPYSSAASETGTTRQRLLLWWQAMKQQRLSWFPVWQELSEQILPDSGRFFLTDKARAGQRHDEAIINSTPRYACRVLAAGMMAGITSPARPWFHITTPDPDLAEFDPVKLWLAQVEDRIRQALARSNIYKQLSKLYYDLSTFGQCPLFVEEDPRDILRASVYPVGSYALAMNGRGQVDTLFRECGMTVRQLVEKFGLERCSSQVQVMAKNPGKQETWIDLLHVVMPRAASERATGYGGRSMPWKSCWLELAADSRTDLLFEGGFEQCPLMAPRWETTGEDAYGSNNPGRMVLGDCKQLQLMESRKLQVIEKIADPPMQAPSSMRMERISLMPGDVNYVPGTSQQKFSPAYEVHPQALQGLRAEISAVEQRIRQGYYADLWLMFAEADAGQPITAREVAERHEEKMLQLGPVMENLEDELLDPLVDRTFGVLMRNGYLPPPPDELAGTELRIEYISMMAQAQKLLGTANLERLLGTAGNVAGVAPEIIDNFDLDETLRTLADMYGTPPKILRTKDAVARLRAAKAKAQQDAARMQAMGEAAKGAQVLSQADMTSDNALTRLVNNAGPVVAAQAGRSRPA